MKTRDSFWKFQRFGELKLAKVVFLIIETMSIEMKFHHYYKLYNMKFCLTVLSLSVLVLLYGFEPLCEHDFSDKGLTEAKPTSCWAVSFSDFVGLLSSTCVFLKNDMGSSLFLNLFLWFLLRYSSELGGLNWLFSKIGTTHFIDWG